MRRRNVSVKSQDESTPLIHTTNKPNTIPNFEKARDAYKNGYKKQWIQALVDYTP